MLKAIVCVCGSLLFVSLLMSSVSAFNAEESCKLPAEVGRCRSRKALFFFNEKSGRCEGFFYGGCGGNENRFESVDECERKCTAFVTKRYSSTDLFCNQGAQVDYTDDCEGDQKERAFTWDYKVGKCVPYEHNGCPILTNIFRRVDDCMNRCAPKTKNVNPSCLLPADVGPCRGHSFQFYYNSDRDRCEAFVYGGCKGNDNRFESIADCQRTCLGAETPIVEVKDKYCLRTPDDNDECEGFGGLVDFGMTWDSEEGQCIESSVSGCGHANNLFRSAQECVHACAPVERKLERSYVCGLPPTKDGVQSCLGRVPRWTFDAEGKTCVKFLYSGCGGTQNLFKSEPDCFEFCAPIDFVLPELPPLPDSSKPDFCSLPPVKEGFRDCLAHIKKWTYDSQFNGCRVHYYGGCGATKNLFDSEPVCLETCGGSDVIVDGSSPGYDICKLPPYEEPSGCDEPIESYTYNDEKGACEMFMYNGCGKTENVFDTLAACQARCPQRGVAQRFQFPQEQDNSVRKVKPLFCFSDPILPLQGNRRCKAFLPMWTFDSKTNECKGIVYGGCGASENLYKTQDDCQNACVNSESSVSDASPDSGVSRNYDICELPRYEEPPSDPSKCKAVMPRWSYNSEEKKCEPFLYNGCGATENVFTSEAACKDRCSREASQHSSKSPEVCFQSIDAGKCRKAIPKYAFDQDKNKCVVFFYGGCGGNDNRFNTADECLNHCGGDKPENLKDVLKSPSQSNLLDLMKDEAGEVVIADKIANCANVKCDNREIYFQMARGCFPIIRLNEGECCPTRFDCSTFEQKRREKKQCYFQRPDEVEGSWYNVGDPIPKVNDYDNCKINCRCKEDFVTGYPTISCLSSECPLMHRPEIAADRTNCIREHSSLEQCCDGSLICDDNRGEKTATCEVEGVTYHEGQIFYPESEPCLKCLCNKDFDGSLTEPTCKRVQCGLLLNTAKMMQGCKPVYYSKDSCCPIEWNCNKSAMTKDSIGADVENAGSLTISKEDVVEIVVKQRIRIPKTELCSDCDIRDIRYKMAKGCVPNLAMLQKGTLKYDCSGQLEEAVREGKCYYAKPGEFGKFYDQGEQIPEISEASGCRQGCFCSGPESAITCAHVDCFPNRKFEPNGNCVNVHSTLNSCCSQQECDSDREASGNTTTCSYEEKTYFEGQKIYPKHDPCKVCLCQKGFDDVEDKMSSPFCGSIECGFTIETRHDCEPEYFDESRCCPFNWKCPQN